MSHRSIPWLDFGSNLFLSFGFVKAIISRDEFGVLGADDDSCWPQMACMVPTLDEEVVLNAYKHYSLWSFSGPVLGNFSGSVMGKVE